MKWESFVDEWINRKRTVKPFYNEIITIFNLAFENITIPELTHFGYSSNMSTIGLMFQSIYAISISGNSFAIIVDTKDLDYRTTNIGISSTKKLNLYWAIIEIKDFQKAINDKKLWKHYKIATQILPTQSILIGTRHDWLEGKMQLTQIYSQKNENFNQNLEAGEFEKQVSNSLKNSHTKRLKRLQASDKKPKTKKVTIKVYIRNPDVVAEVLYRAKEICQHCKKPAPFKRDTNGLGYLEVHHIEPLSENGDDTVENSIALCANCHRHAHYGEKSFKI